MICSFVSGCVPFVLPYLPYLPVVLTYSVLVGTFSGSFGSLMGVIIVDVVGLENYSPAFAANHPRKALAMISEAPTKETDKVILSLPNPNVLI
jgi:hypothetical protein